MTAPISSEVLCYRILNKIKKTLLLPSHVCAGYPPKVHDVQGHIASTQNDPYPLQVLDPRDSLHMETKTKETSKYNEKQKALPQYVL